ncbi:extracellular sulfatase SULF-1 homolog isoform X1 [Dendroctonus ponderosae]|uniref:Sulfatase N-terminal domain-containing protein n=1 Tax=Dendroctonus ponderosae TaxID=77166 RepID=A0AAR5P9B2_DENPD|nr:extracellular sulfatase SULF-1 homolog isoform X1 [Dendroctonus ponderosae]
MDRGVLLVLMACAAVVVGDVSSRRKQRPANIVLFLTDDQDVELGSLNYMPKTLKHVRDQGVEFRHAYVTTPMCCPSRSSLLTGMYIHNHQVFTNKDNCSSPRWQATHETKSFATYLSNAGYRTGYFGKYLNKYNGTYVPPGWREWGGLIMNSKYYNYSLNMNGQTRRHGFEYEKDYYTDVIARDSINFIRHSKKQYPNKPIMLVLAFPAPHGPEDSAPQYAQQYFNVTTHHTPSYNYAPNPDKQWILQVTGRMEAVHKDFTDLLMTKRLQTLQSVDDAVEAVVKELHHLEELDNTYVVYTSDHGYHLGQFGLIKGKSFPFEFDVRVPFLVRGPGIEPGATLNEIVLNIDLAPTFLDLAGVRVPPQMDGHSILPLLFNRRRVKWHDTFLIESSGRRETPHLETKRHEGNLLQYSVPQNASDLNNELLVQLFKNTPLDGAKAKPGDYLSTNLITRKGGALSRASRDAFKCLNEAQWPCRGRQRWFCKQENGKWRKYKCREEKAVLDDEEKQCVCFTAEGTIIKPYLKRNQRKDEYKYCFCDEEGQSPGEKVEDLEEKTRLRKQKKREEVCHHERMTCFEHNNDHWRTAPRWTGGQFCFCMNANNNTYSCLRTINLSHNFLYCEFTTGFITFYNLRIDPFELQNRYDHLNRTERGFLHDVLKQMVTCKGAACIRHLNTPLRLSGFPQARI